MRRKGGEWNLMTFGLKSKPLGSEEGITNTGGTGASILQTKRDPTDFGGKTQGGSGKYQLGGERRKTRQQRFVNEKRPERKSGESGEEECNGQSGALTLIKRKRRSTYGEERSVA